MFVGSGVFSSLSPYLSFGRTRCHSCQSVYDDDSSPKEYRMCALQSALDDRCLFLRMHTPTNHQHMQLADAANAQSASSK
jgi:hypothetical protein